MNIYVENGFYADFLRSDRCLCSFGGETICILYFFGLGKYTKKSLWSHLFLISDSLNVKRMPS